MTYEVLVENAAFEIGRHDDGTIVGACKCGSGFTGSENYGTKLEASLWKHLHRACAEEAQ